MKTCTKCGETKPLSEFSRKGDSRDGVNTRCKLCDAAAKREYRANNKERYNALHREQQRAWRAANPDRYRAYKAAWRNKNHEKAKQYAVEYYRKWRSENIEKSRAATSKWAAMNRDKCNIRFQNYKARKSLNGGTLSRGLAEKLYGLQKGKCACCGLPLGDDYHLDHIMPLALGGTNTDDNIQLLRSTCNVQKHAKHPVDFMQERGFLL